MEGKYWKNNRAGINDRNMEKIEMVNEVKLPSTKAPEVKHIDHSGGH